MKRLNLLFISTVFVLGSIKSALAGTCDASLWPVYAGGQSQEFVNCFMLDLLNDRIIVGGNSTSYDWQITNGYPTGFLYALDLDGNWMWGNRYLTQHDSHIVDISGCTQSDWGISALGTDS